jgi:hypothetical protein
MVTAGSGAQGDERDEKGDRLKKPTDTQSYNKDGQHLKDIG